jgi:hypothetical protein
VYVPVAKTNPIIFVILDIELFATKKIIDSACPIISNCGGFVKGNGDGVGFIQSLPHCTLPAFRGKVGAIPIC